MASHYYDCVQSERDHAVWYANDFARKGDAERAAYWTKRAERARTTLAALDAEAATQRQHASTDGATCGWCGKPLGGTLAGRATCSPHCADAFRSGTEGYTTVGGVQLW